jgi:molecular chaperone HscC
MAIVGIDLGTTNTLVAAMRDGAPVTLPNEMGEHLLPSAVAVAKDGATLVGRAASDRLVQEPNAGRAFFKRDMGTATHYAFGGRRWTPVECSAVVLAEAKRVASLHLPGTVDRAVITVPAYFRESQRQATAEAARLAGLQVARMLNEPTAAALAFGFRAPEIETKLLVFDIGGGTFDVTVLEMFSGVVEVRASGGESRLGGEDFTDALLDLVLQRCGKRRDTVAVGLLRARLESLKRRLSTQACVGLVVDGHELTISREDLATAGASLTARLQPVVAQCLRDARLRREELDGVLLVGGASRMHVIRELVAREVRTPLVGDVDPDRVVALGAAVQAGLVDRDAAVTDLVLTDVCAHTLGIETSKEFVTQQHIPGFFEPIIERNTTVPVSRAKQFRTLTPQQDTLTIAVYQGESRRTAENHLLGKLRVTGLRRRPPDHGEIDVRFTYDMSGLLEVDVTVLHTGTRFHALLEQRPGTLTPKQIAEIRARLEPLRVAPRDHPAHRARLERAERAYSRLLGDERLQLTALLDAFEQALRSEIADSIAAAAAELDEFLAAIAFEEGEWQPPPDDGDERR